MAHPPAELKWSRYSTTSRRRQWIFDAGQDTLDLVGTQKWTLARSGERVGGLGGGGGAGVLPAKVLHPCKTYITVAEPLSRLDCGDGVGRRGITEGLVRVDDDGKVARTNKRSKSFPQRVRRLAMRHGLGRDVGGSSYAEDIYYAAVATLVDGGVVSKWVRRRDVHGGPMAQAVEWGFASGSDMYWAEKLAVGFLGPYFGAVDEHSGLPVEKQLEVLRRVRFVGPDAAPQTRWSVHRNYDVLQRMVNVLTQSGYFRGRAAQVWIVIMVQIACAQMATDGAILPETRLLELVRGNGGLPEEAKGLSMEQYEVLSELRDGARIHRD